jgi:transcriptional regulator with XRE-family HTH domain
MVRGVADPLRVRVGAFVRARRQELGLSQGDVIARLGYKSRNSVSNLELGLEGLPARRAHEWADLLEVDRDAFYRVVTGLEPVPASAAAIARRTDLDELVTIYKTLGPSGRRRLLEKARRYAEKHAQRSANG